MDDDQKAVPSPAAVPAPDARDRLLGLPDAEIVARLRAGDMELFRALFRAYHQPLVRMAHVYLHVIEAAEEVVADTLSRLWERREAWEIHHSVESYLFGAVRHRAQNVLRSARREQHWAEVFEHETLPAMGAPPEAPDTAATNADLRDRLWRAVATLPKRTQLILSLRWRQEMTFEEIAETVGVAPAAIRQIHSRALRQLRTEFPELLR